MRRIAAVIGIFALSVAAVACTTEGRADAGAPSSKQLWREPSSQPSVPAVTLPAQGSLAPLIKALKPAVVNVYTTTVVKHPQVRQFGGPPRGGPGDQWQEFFERFFGRPFPEEPEEFRGSSLGSGFVVNAGGYVLTNNHVVKDASEIRVRLADNREFAAKVVGRDPPLDVAVIRLEDAKDLPTVVLGDSDSLEQGDFVLALGNPFGLRGSAAFGIVSAKDRSTGGTYDDFIQTDAAINPGNSGGPLFNLRGEVVGINTAIVSPQLGQGIGFAVPINLAKQVIPQLVAQGKVSRGYLGVTVSELTPELAQGFGLPAKTEGALVQNVVAKAPAEQAGVKNGDVVVALNGKPVKSSSDLTRAVALIPPGTKVQLTVLRGGKKQDLTASLAERPSEEALARGEFEPEEGGEEGEEAKASPKAAKLGVKLSALTPELARQLGVEGDQGVVVTGVDAAGSAARAGVRRGDLILEVNRKAVSRPAQVAEAVRNAKAGDVVLLRVRRGSSAVYVPVRIEAPGAEGKAAGK